MSGLEVKACVEGFPRYREWGPGRTESVGLGRSPLVPGLRGPAGVP